MGEVVGGGFERIFERNILTSREASGEVVEAWGGGVPWLAEGRRMMANMDFGAHT